MATSVTEEKDFNKLIVKLRETTGAGIMDCKKALTEAKGSYDEAITILRKKGQADAAKKSARVTKEGVVAFMATASSGAMIELNSETDFVARTPEFQQLAQTLAEKFARHEFNSSEEARPLIEPVFAKLGENMGLKRFMRFELNAPGLIAGYIHLGAKKGAIIELSAHSEQAAKSAELSELAKELLLQIVGLSPKYLKREEVPASEIAKEREIHTEILTKEGKPEAQIAKIVEGKINKLFYQQFCLLEQMSVRDNKTPVAAIIKAAGAKLAGAVAVTRFARYQLGE